MKKLTLLVVISLFIPFSIFAQQIKPGVVITQTNYREYLPELKRLLNPGTLRVVVDSLERGLITLPIVETEVYPQSKPYHEATMKYAGTCKLRKDNWLIGWKAGMPFPDPKNGAELAWNLDRRNLLTDQYSFYGDFYLYDLDKPERTLTWHYRTFYFNGRVLRPPIPEVPGNNGVTRFKESIVVLKPFDVKGFSMLRTRYEAIDRSDDVFSYIPAIRRMRRLTGADVTDPLLGSDYIYDDFEYLRQKITPKMTFKMGERELLVPSVQIEPEGPVGYENTRKENALQTDWQIRTVLVLEININDPDYIYSKRVYYMEKQRLTAVGYALDAYDQRNRLYRTHSMVIPTMVGGPTYAGKGWHGDRGDNVISGHNTVMFHRATHANPDIRMEHFSFRKLLKEAR